MLFLDLIAKKRDGGRHTPGELAFISRAAAKGLAPDYQLSREGADKWVRAGFPKP